MVANGQKKDRSERARGLKSREETPKEGIVFIVRRNMPGKRSFGNSAMHIVRSNIEETRRDSVSSCGNRNS